MAKKAKKLVASTKTDFLKLLKENLKINLKIDQTKKVNNIVIYLFFSSGFINI